MEEEVTSGRSSQLQRQRLRFQARLNCKYLCSPPPRIVYSILIQWLARKFRDEN